ncbi:RNA polymerase sigma factor [Brevibacillus brevis]|uniref:RNA polymerase sigma factor n=1 Tax=Brevibacillus brevis TaxID=1393 RepID=UPI000D0E828D|nr:sigma-70 family RNA polymerase sigma factor [Brevibacillus brevis]PSJ68088.1 RNA polymerase [Brevibacillus brevis]RED35566.1 RNA polymerase sigma-70 factor (ECF subfamily) [Brevibacillus brevis]GEC87761.1 DNA-directed RNA polymerase sigma-70 factor [Brevibacillus brevis]VEF89323.1 Sigma-K factor [Brevibacillus brevis]
MKENYDAELMRLVNEKNGHALEELYDRYIKLVYGFVMKFCNGNEDKTKEIIQLVFLRLWTTNSHYDPTQGSFVNWLLTITRNICIDYLRKEKRHTQYHREEHVEIADPVNAVEQRVNTNEIAMAKNKLPTAQRKLIDLLYWKGYSLSEIAKLEQEPLGTIKSRLHQALKGLRKHLETEDIK